MESVDAFTALLVRAAYLIAFAVAPTAVSPDPWIEGMDIIARALPILLLFGVPALFWLVARSIDTTIARAAAIGSGVTVVVSIVVAAFFTHDAEPIARSVAAVALCTWISLALTGATLADRFLGQLRFKQTRTAGSVVVLAVGLKLLGGQANRLNDVNALWWDALSADAKHDRAFAALAAQPLAKRDFAAAAKVASRCLGFAPTQCGCLALTARVAAEKAPVAEARKVALAGVDACPNDARTNAALAEIQVRAGTPEEGLATARKALETAPNDGRLHLAAALALDGTGDTQGALVEAKKALELGAGRDAALLAGALSILLNDLDGAKALLSPLVEARKDDVDAIYNLALVADKRNDYNGARQGYLATLQVDPKFANARFNLTKLTLRFGILEEAKHHASKFMTAFPNDPRGAALVQDIAAATPPPPPPPAPSPSASAPTPSPAPRP